MAKVYYDLINKGLWKIEDVPPRWREDVQAMLDSEAVGAPPVPEPIPEPEPEHTDQPIGDQV